MNHQPRLNAPIIPYRYFFVDKRHPYLAALRTAGLGSNNPLRASRSTHRDASVTLRGSRAVATNRAYTPDFTRDLGTRRGAPRSPSNVELAELRRALQLTQVRMLRPGPHCRTARSVVATTGSRVCKQLPAARRHGDGQMWPDLPTSDVASITLATRCGAPAAYTHHRARPRCTVHVLHF